MKVSVVVPVFNPGANIEPTIESLLKQSLDPTDYEVIFVDDGSTDQTPALLDQVAAEQANVTVIHTPNSGWPGRPRNIGIDTAQGDYVYFVDHDDRVSEQALERLYAYAVDNDSDIVIGKIAGHGRDIPKALFRDNLPDAKLGTDPILALLTPHKLFRRSMLERHGVRFPEGHRRLEDHVFVMQAYFAAERISILADYVCYHWILHGSNASHVPVDPKIYYSSLRDALDVVDAHVPPGPFRDKLHRHWYTVKMLAALNGKKLLRKPEPYRALVFEEIRGVALERFGPGVAAKMGSLRRIEDALLRAGRLDLLVALAEHEVGLTIDSEVVGSSWRAGALRLRHRAAIVDSSGRPLAFEHRGARALWRLPATITDADPDQEIVLPKARDAAKELPMVRVELLVRSTGDGGEYVLPGTTKWVGKRADASHLDFIGETTIDPATAAAGLPLTAGRWNLMISIRGCGLARTAKLAGVGPKAIASVVVDDNARMVLEGADSGRGLRAAGRGKLHALQLDPKFETVRERTAEVGQRARRSPALRRVAGTLRDAHRRVPRRRG